MAEERLQKVLAKAGLGSRRSCEELITAGRVTVDGRLVTELGTTVDAAAAEIRVDGKLISAERFRYIMLNKPTGYLSNPDARAGYPSWMELVHTPERLFAVGRLDLDSEGLLLLTNDGPLAQHLTHPRYEHPKTYLVLVQGVPNPRKVRRLQHGVMLEDGPTAPADVALLRTRPQGVEETGGRPPGPTRWLQVTMREGRKRQLRRMFGLLGHPVLRVIRIVLGPLKLGDLRPGKWRDLKPEEVGVLRELVQSDEPPAASSARPRTRSGVSISKGARTPAGAPKSPSPAPRVIAIDGPASSGKSTVGRALAQGLGYLYFDTGVMYRAVTAVAQARDLDVKDERAVTALAEQVVLEVLPSTIADGRDVTVLADGVDITADLRRPEVERAVSAVSAYVGVRRAMAAQQRRIGQGGRVVMVGRDIGTVILPEADLKIYLDASLQERARRRYLERQARGERVTQEQVMADMRKRDAIDSGRTHSPLAMADDAILVDTTDLPFDEVVARVRSLVARRTSTGSGGRR